MKNYLFDDNDLIMFKNWNIADIQQEDEDDTNDLIITLKHPVNEETMKLHIQGNELDIFTEESELESPKYSLHEPTIVELEELKKMNVCNSADVVDGNGVTIGHSVIYCDNSHCVSLHLYNNGKLLISNKF